MTDIDKASRFAPPSPPSKEKRILGLSTFFEYCISRFPVLRFFGICKSAGRGEMGLRRPRSLECRSFSSPGESSCQLGAKVGDGPAPWARTFRCHGSVKHVHVDAVICGTSHLPKRPLCNRDRQVHIPRENLPFCSSPSDSSIIGGHEDRVFRELVDTRGI